MEGLSYPGEANSGILNPKKTKCSAQNGLLLTFTPVPAGVILLILL